MISNKCTVYILHQFTPFYLVKITLVRLARCRDVRRSHREYYYYAAKPRKCYLATICPLKLEQVSYIYPGSFIQHNMRLLITSPP